MNLASSSVHECGECIYVANRESIVIPKSITQVLEKNRGKPIFINFFTMPGWFGHASFYAFICSECNSFSIDYPHGYTGPGFIFLTCQTCDLNLILLEDEIYEREGMKPPPTLLELAYRLAKLRFTMLKSRFIRLGLSLKKKLKT